MDSDRDGHRSLRRLGIPGVRDNAQAGWRQNIFKMRKVKNAVNAALGDLTNRVDDILEIVKAQHDY